MLLEISQVNSVHGFNTVGFSLSMNILLCRPPAAVASEAASVRHQMVQKAPKAGCLFH